MVDKSTSRQVSKQLVDSVTLQLVDSVTQSLLYRIEVGVGTVRIEDFVTIHNGNEVLRVGEVDDVMRVARKHND